MLDPYDEWRPPWWCLALVPLMLLSVAIAFDFLLDFDRAMLRGWVRTHLPASVQDGLQFVLASVAELLEICEEGLEDAAEHWWVGWSWRVVWYGYLALAPIGVAWVYWRWDRLVPFRLRRRAVWGARCVIGVLRRRREWIALGLSIGMLCSIVAMGLELFGPPPWGRIQSVFIDVRRDIHP